MKMKILTFALLFLSLSLVITKETAKASNLKKTESKTEIKSTSSAVKASSSVPDSHSGDNFPDMPHNIQVPNDHYLQQIKVSHIIILTNSY